MDTPEQQLTASRLVATVLREMLREERARSDRYRDALMRIRTMSGEDVIADVHRIAAEAMGGSQ